MATVCDNKSLYCIFQSKADALRDTVQLDVYKRHQEMLIQHNLLEQHSTNSHGNVVKSASTFPLDNKLSVHHLIGNTNHSSTNHSETLPPRSFHHLTIHNKPSDSQSHITNGSSGFGGNSYDRVEVSNSKESSRSRPSVIQHTPFGLHSNHKDSNGHKRPYPFSSSLFVSPPYIPLPTPPPAHSTKKTAHVSPYVPLNNKQPRLSVPPSAHQPPTKPQPPLNIIDVDRPAEYTSDFSYGRPELYPSTIPSSSRSTSCEADVPLNLSIKSSSERSFHHRKSSTLMPTMGGNRSYHQVGDPNNHNSC